MFNALKKRASSRASHSGAMGAAPFDVAGIELPTFPQIVMSALEKARDEHSRLSELGDLLATDPGLSVRILQTVNSAAFGARQRVENIHHAVSLLGRNEIESLLIATGVKSALPGAPAPGFEPTRFWTCAAKRAAAARALASRIHPATASHSFTASLLQDMAVPLLASIHGASYADVLGRWHESDRDLAELERLSFDWDHAVVAAWMGEQWSFPDVLVDAIGAHHGTAEGRYRGLPAVDLVALIREVNESAGVDRLINLVEDRHQIPREETEALLAESEEDAVEIARLFV